MTTTSESNPPSFICCEHIWTFSSSKDTLFLSEFIGICGVAIEKAFRFGAETDHNCRLAKVCCYVNSVELARFGFVVNEVTCAMKEQEGFRDLTGLQENDDRNGNAIQLKLENVNQNGNAILFLRLLESQHVFKHPCLTFRLKFSELVKQYAPCRFDVNIGQQLWNAAVNAQGTDVVFEVGDSTFPANKFVLAARSPVFRTMFDTDMVESRTGRVQVVDATPGVFEEFLYFLYSGQLVKPMSKQLEMVAEKYQVETLASLCRGYFLAIESSNDDVLDSVATSVQQLKRPENSKTLSRQPTENQQSDLLHTEVYIVKNVLSQMGKGAQTLAKCLRFKIEDDYGDDDEEYVVTFYSSWSNSLAWKVTAVDLFVVNDYKRVRSEHSMEPLIPSKYVDKQPLQIFRSSGVVVQQRSHSLRFVVRYVSTVDAYRIQLRDSLLAQELWSSVVNKERTDVEFQVGGQTFSAHRAFFAARCPAIAALIPDAESSPSSSPPSVWISDMDPIVFEDVLYFLYTGTIRDHNKILEQTHQQHLSDAARNYQIQTLSGVMEQKVDHNELSEILMSIF